MQQQYAQKLLVVIADAESLADTVTAATDTLKSDSAESQVESVEEKADSQSNNVVDVKAEFNALNEKFDGLKAQLSSIPKGLMSRWKKPVPVLISNTCRKKPTLTLNFVNAESN